jgi:hypothetical protein
MALMAQDGSPSLSGEGGRTAGKFTQVAYTSLRAAGWGLRPRSEITALIARVARLRYRVLRFMNSEVPRNTDGIVEKRFAEARQSPPASLRSAPSPPREGR